MKTITSAQNDLFRRAVQAAQRLGPGRQQNECLIEGEKLISEALRAGVNVHSLFLLAESSSEDTLRAILSGFPLQASADLEARTCLLPLDLMKRLSALETPPRSAAIISLPPGPDFADVLASAERLVILDRVQDPGNVGTIIRTCAALGADALLLLNGCCSRRNPKVLRSAMGASFRFPVFEGLRSRELLSLLEPHHFTTIAADSSGDSLPEANLPAKVAIFLGAEGQGLHPELKSACHRTLAIEMSPNSESLNVATTAALFLYELFQRRRGKNTT